MALPFAIFYRLEVSEQALSGIPLDFGIVVEDKPSDFHNIVAFSVDYCLLHIKL